MIRVVASFSIVIPAFFVAGQTIAGCPTRDDMAAGVGVVRDDSVIVVYFTLDDVAVAQTLDFGGGLVAHNVLFHGSYPFSMRMEQDKVEDEEANVVFAYELQPSQMAIPAAGLEQELRTYVRPKFDPQYPEIQFSTWGEETDIMIGGCPFLGIFGTIDYVNDQSVIREGLMYLSDLGISLQVSFDVVGDPSQSYVYAYTDITDFE